MDAWSTIVTRLGQCSSAVNLTLDDEAKIARADFARFGRAEADAVWADLSALLGVVPTRSTDCLSLTFEVSAPIGSGYAPGSRTVTSGNFLSMTKRLQLTTTQRLTVVGTGRLRIT